MADLIINPTDIQDGAGRELNHAMGHFMDALMKRFPGLIPAAMRGFKLRVTVSDGTAWEAHGGAAPVPPMAGHIGKGGFPQ